MIQSEWRQDDGYSESILSAADGHEVIKFRAVKNGEGRYDALGRHAQTGEMVLHCSKDYATQEEAQASCNAAVRYVKRLADKAAARTVVNALIGIVDALVAETKSSKPTPTGVNLTGVDPSLN